jgi:hypothetical protein
VVPKGGRARPETPGKQTRKLWSPFPASLPPPPMSGLISLPSCARHAWALGAGKGGREAAKLGNLFTEGPGCFSELTGRAESALQPRVLVLITRSTLALQLFLCSRSTLSGCGRQQAGPEAWEKKGWLCLHPCRETKMGVSVCVWQTGHSSCLFQCGSHPCPNLLSGSARGWLQRNTTPFGFLVFV